MRRSDVRFSSKALVAFASIALLAPLLTAPATLAAGESYVRVNQVGYLFDGPKTAMLMSSEAPVATTFQVVTDAGVTAFTGPLDAPQPEWSAAYSYVYELDFASLQVPGTYRVAVGDTTSSAFKIGGAELFAPLLTDSIAFYRAQRDGPDVDESLLDRKPSHLDDASASVYKSPIYSGGVLQGGLKKIGGPIDASGGWADAGDYGKFVMTTSYVQALLLIALRDGAGAAQSDLDAEARFGLEWLEKMWSHDDEVLYYQVGLAEGNDKIRGDHDFWRLPEDDDDLNVGPGDAAYFVKYRPVFRANAPGSKISPNLAGRMAAVFALCAQVYRTSDPAMAGECLEDAQTLFARAKTRNVGKLITIAPYSGYPETEWRDDLEFAATEIALAMEGQPSAEGYLDKALKWGHAYLDKESGDSLNVYDVGGVAHPELVAALTTFGRPASAAEPFLNELVGKLEASEKRAAKDPFALGTYYFGYDQVPRALGVAVEAMLYDSVTGTTRFEELAWDQIDWALGANPWGTSFVVGAGTTFPHCIHHQIANLNGALDGSGPLLRGATAPGPNLTSQFKGLGTSEEMRRCPVGGGDEFKQFSGRGIRYLDNVKSWPTVEPAIDYTITTTLVLDMLANDS
ncbi:MAG: endoglucanase [Actinomycetota bacterium]|jgi:endoglucanase|nr:endoglucanase [Actinomycetota bacterium]